MRRRINRKKEARREERRKGKGDGKNTVDALWRNI